MDKLSTHFAAPQDEEQIQIFLDALTRNSDYQIEVAFERCLNECTYMPRLRDVHEKMPEEREERKVWTYSTSQKHHLDEVREIAREMFPNYDQLEGKELMEAAGAATLERYRRMGIDTKNWSQSTSSTGAAK